MNYITYSYQKVASKLSSFVIHNQPVRIIFCFSYSDPGRDIANLSFIKQFGVVPEEINISLEKEVNISQDMNGFSGLTIIINSVSVNGTFSGSDISDKYQTLIKQQSEMITNHFQKDHKSYTKEYIYISGFSVSSSNSLSKQFAETEFLPWYLEIDKNSSLDQIVRQPELNRFMQQLTEEEPQIPCLDKYLNGMIDRENETVDAYPFPVK